MSVETGKNNSLVRMPVEVHVWVFFISVAIYDMCEIWGYSGGNCEDFRRLYCDAV